ncbi:MAG: outer membrane beta-barrel protein [Pseudomonadota bacterium]
MLTKKSRLAAVVVFTTGLLVATDSLAGMNGPYIGAIVGYGFLHQSSVSEITTSSSSSTGIAGRVDAGFQFGPYFSFEAGYTKYSNAVVKGYSDTIINGVSTFNSYSIDGLVRGTLPLGPGFAIYGKIGPAYLKEISTFNGTSIDPDTAGENVRIIDTESKVFPEFGIGALYDITNNFVAEITWLHIQRLGDNSLRNADFAGLGLTYNFG